MFTRYSKKKLCTHCSYENTCLIDKCIKCKKNMIRQTNIIDTNSSPNHYTQKFEEMSFIHSNTVFLQNGINKIPSTSINKTRYLYLMIIDYITVGCTMCKEMLLKLIEYGKEPVDPDQYVFTDVFQEHMHNLDVLSGANNNNIIPNNHTVHTNYVDNYDSDDYSDDDYYADYHNNNQIKKNPATPDQISLIKIIDEKVDGMCVICQSNFSDEEQISILPCGHIMHHICISEWLQYQNICPIGRCKIVELGKLFENN